MRNEKEKAETVGGERRRPNLEIRKKNSGEVDRNKRETCKKEERGGTWNGS